MKRFDRSSLEFYPLSSRENRVFARDVFRDIRPSDENLEKTHGLAQVIRNAAGRGASRTLAFGAHTIKNGMGPVIAKLIQNGHITHCATNGAGIIHDWELAYQGETSEHVKENVARGMFGMWTETVRNLNLAICVGAFRGWGYGESIGHLVAESGITVPSKNELSEAKNGKTKNGDDPDIAAAAWDLEATLRRIDMAPADEPRKLEIRHRYPEVGLQAAALEASVPFTAHPMFGHDIIYTHPACSGPAIGRTADRDFLSYAGSISGLEGGVYISVGSAVMSPMIFEKSLSMARNAAIQAGRNIDDFDIYVVDLADSDWDWEKNGEPPSSDPAYYIRFNKSFSRMGGRFRYIRMDATGFFPALCEHLR